MAFALKLYDDGRIHSASSVLHKGMPIVDYLPTGETEPEQDITNYRYVLDENLDTGELSWAYEYDPKAEPDPKPDPEPVEPTPTLEERVSAVEDQLAFTKIILGVE